MPTKLRISNPSRAHFALAWSFLLVLPAELCTWAPGGFADLVKSESPASRASSTMPSLKGLRPGIKIAAELQSTLDVLATKSGDEVAARVTGNVKRRGRIVIHKGDRLVGRVISVQPQNVRKGQANSEVAISFDRLQRLTTTYRLNTVVHSVVWVPSQLRDEAEAPEETDKTPARAMAIGGTHGGPHGGPRGVHGTVEGPDRKGEVTGSGVAYPRGGAPPSDSIKARSDPATDGRSGAVSVLSDRKGNLRLRAGTRLEFRTQGQ